MAHINLLPWREEERKRKKSEFITVAVVAIAMTVVFGLVVHLYYVGLITYQISRNDFLKEEIRKVDAKIKEIQDLEQKKEQLIARMRIIERLQGNRPEVVHMFDEMVRLVPEGLYLENMTQNGKMISITGRAQSNARVSAYMRALEGSEWFDLPSLNVISTKKDRGTEKFRQFSLKVKQLNPMTQSEEDSEGGPDKGAKAGKKAEGEAK